jgi:hypothetical protein
VSRVFLIAEPTVGRNRKVFKLEPLEKFGTVVPIIKAGFNARLHRQRAFQIVHEALKDYDPTEDYLVWAGGDMLVAIMAGIALERLGHESVNWLYWERDLLENNTRAVTGHYVPGELIIYEPPPEAPDNERLSA